MPKDPVFVGIDVACALRKRLPICVVWLNGSCVEPIEIPDGVERQLPRGLGNGEVLQNDPFRRKAVRIADALNHASEECGWNIVRVAIDAPAAPPSIGERIAEKALRQCRLSSFRTPDTHGWQEIFKSCRDHQRRDGKLNRMPYANKIWMLYGFEIFKALRKNSYEVIEVYPYAIVRTLLSECPHKTTEEGYRRQLGAVASATKWKVVADLERALCRAVRGSRHDRLDAFMAAWVATLSRDERRAYGNENDPNDAIWVPRKDLERSRW